MACLSCNDDDRQIDFALARNEDWAFSIEMENVDATGHTFYLTVRQYEGAPDPALFAMTSAAPSLNDSSFTTVSNSATLSVIAVIVTSADLLAIAAIGSPPNPDMLVYDVLDVDTSGIGSRVIYGNIALAVGVSSRA